MGSFEDLLNGLVGDEPEDEEATLPGTSRFARFFSCDADGASSAHAAGARGPSLSGGALGQGLGGVGLDPPYEANAGKQHDEWQQGCARCCPTSTSASRPSVPPRRLDRRRRAQRRACPLQADRAPSARPRSPSVDSAALVASAALAPLQWLAAAPGARVCCGASLERPWRAVVRRRGIRRARQRRRRRQLLV